MLETHPTATCNNRKYAKTFCKTQYRLSGQNLITGACRLASIAPSCGLKRLLMARVRNGPYKHKACDVRYGGNMWAHVLTNHTAALGRNQGNQTCIIRAYKSVIKQTRQEKLQGAWYHNVIIIWDTISNHETSKTLGYILDFQRVLWEKFSIRAPPICLCLYVAPVCTIVHATSNMSNLRQKTSLSGEKTHCLLYNRARCMIPRVSFDLPASKTHFTLHNLSGSNVYLGSELLSHGKGG